MQRFIQTVDLLVAIGQLVLVGVLLLIAREVWHLFAWTGAAR